MFGSDRSSRNANVRIFVRSLGSSLSRAVNLHLTRSEIDQSTQGVIREHLGSNQSISIRVIQSEPKILRLVILAGQLLAICIMSYLRGFAPHSSFRIGNIQIKMSDRQKDMYHSQTKKE